MGGRGGDVMEANIDVDEGTASGEILGESLRIAQGAGARESVR